MITAPFEYVRPTSLDEALAALADPEAMAIAGGHSLLPLMKLRLARPATVVDLARLDLRGVASDGKGLRIGALTTYDELLACDPRLALPDALADAAAAVGDLQVRNAGTIGGAVAHGDPASDVAAALLALDARAVLRSPAGERECPLSAFFVGPFETALQRPELLVELVVPERPTGGGSAYASVESPASGYPIVGIAAVVSTGGVVLGVTGTGGRPFRARSIADVLDRLGLAANEDDEYVHELAATVAARVLAAATERCG